MKHLRKIVLTAAIAPALFVLSAQAQFLYDPFPTTYGDGGGLGSVGTTWNIGNGISTTGGPIATNAAQLSYSGLQTTAGTYGAYLNSGTTVGNRNRGASFATVSAGSLYASFLLNVQAGPVSSNRLFAALSTATSGSSMSAQTASIWINPANQLLISKSSSAGLPTSGTTAALSAGTHLVVVRYTFDAVNPDEFALWLDPGSLGAGSAPGSTLSILGTDVLTTGLSSFFLAKTTVAWLSAAVDLYIDELRIGNTWAEVTPSAVPEPSTIALLGVAAMGLIAGYRRFRS